jgi:hypothetical protein
VVLEDGVLIATYDLAVGTRTLWSFDDGALVEQETAPFDPTTATFGPDSCVAR